MYNEAALTRKDICNMQIYAVLKDSTTSLPLFVTALALRLKYIYIYSEF